MIPISRPDIGEAEKRAVMEVLDSGMLVQGARVASLEERFATACGTRLAVATSSGTTALHLALLAQGIGPGDEVITSAFAFIASVTSILFSGARPVFVDIEEDTFNINPELIEKAVTPRTKAIMPVHLYGYPCDMGAITQIAERHGLAIIEDACQAVGADYHGRRVGSFGLGCFSLYATKNVTSGEGGMITTDDEVVAGRLRMLRNHGMQRRYYHDMLGYNFRMTDLNAAIGLAQMARLDEFTQKRRQNAAYLNAHLSKVITPQVRNGYGHVWHQYTVRLTGRERDSAADHLKQAGVGSGIFYPLPAYRQKPLEALGYGALHLPVTEKMCAEVLSLPVHPLLSQTDLETIVEAVKRL
jgi:dTDP-4-amino-4,6-dideoxygalactose transaminase